MVLLWHLPHVPVNSGLVTAANAAGVGGGATGVWSNVNVVTPVSNTVAAVPAIRPKSFFMVLAVSRRRASADPPAAVVAAAGAAEPPGLRSVRGRAHRDAPQAWTTPAPCRAW